MSKLFKALVFALFHTISQLFSVPDKHPGRCPPGWFPGSDTPPSKWHENKHEDHHYGRAPQESPWDDDYSNDPEESNLSSCAAPGKRNWKRPSSASEMERKVGEMKSRHGGYLGTGKYPIVTSFFACTKRNIS